MKKNFYLSLVVLLCSTIIVGIVSCSQEESIDSENNTQITDSKLLSFNWTVAKIKRLYPEYQKNDSGNAELKTRSSKTCGPESDPSVDCGSVPPIQITLPIAGTGTIYHPSLPPMDCTLEISMDILFCTNSNYNNSTVIFSNLEIESLVSPLSNACTNWLNAWASLSQSDANAVYKELLKDYQAAFELEFMTIWASNPNNEFDKCPTDDKPCELSNNAVQAKYYKASCTKVCAVFEKECDDPWFFLCRKEVPCYSDGCCKKETTYCLDSATGDVKVCHNAYYLQGRCTNPVESNCVVELEPCSDVPYCPSEG